MELILLRHGKAEDFNPTGDAARALVEKGIKQARSAGHLLLAADRRPEVVLTSPRVRARETAEQFCDAAEMPGPVMQSWLDCGMHPEGAIEELVAFADFKRVMIVGHEPDFSSLVEYLLGCEGASVVVKKGAIVALDITLPRSYARLLYSIPPKLIRSEI